MHLWPILSWVARGYTNSRCHRRGRWKGSEPKRKQSPPMCIRQLIAQCARFGTASAGSIAWRKHKDKPTHRCSIEVIGGWRMEIQRMHIAPGFRESSSPNSGFRIQDWSPHSELVSKIYNGSSMKIVRRRASSPLAPAYYPVPTHSPARPPCYTSAHSLGRRTDAN